MLLALGITKPVIRTVITLQIIQLNCNLVARQTWFVITKLKELFLSQRNSAGNHNFQKNKNNITGPTFFFFFLKHIEEL